MYDKKMLTDTSVNSLRQCHDTNTLMTNGIEGGEKNIGEERDTEKEEENEIKKHKKIKYKY